MIIYNMHRERKFPMTITNLAALFLGLFGPPSYIYNQAIKVQLNKGNYRKNSIKRPRSNKRPYPYLDAKNGHFIREFWNSCNL